jgi:hypothetical protein
MARNWVAGCAGLVCLFAQGQQTPSEEDMVLLVPYLNGTALGDGIEAYRVGSLVLVPLGELCRLLAFGITVNPNRSAASGFFINPKRTFALDLEHGTLDCAGRKLPLGATARMPRDLYVDAQSLGVWFPLTVETLLKDSALVLKASEKLPIQEQWERDSKYGAQGMARYSDEEGGTRGVYRSSPYAFLDVPMVDLNLGLGYVPGPKPTQVAGSATLTGDLLWMSANVVTNRDASGTGRNSRATLYREDPQGRMLGPLGARRVELGDLTNAQGMDLVGSLPQGRGFTVDNHPVTYRTRFATRTFRGNLVEGWSVEFFQNESLVGFQRARGDGLYEFKDVPLRFGINLFRLVFHGPLGEVLERTERLDIAQSQPPPGVLYYSLSGVKPTQMDQPFLATDPTAPQVDTPIPPPQAQYMALANYGITPAWSLQAGGAALHGKDGAHTYGSMGVRGVGSLAALQLTGAQDRSLATKPGRALEAILSTGYKYSTLTLRRDQFSNGFQRSAFDHSGLGATGQVVTSATGVDLSWSAKVLETPLSLSAQTDSETYAGGATGTRQRYFLSTQIGLITVSNSLSLTRLPGTTTPAQGNLTLTSFTRTWSWNGNLVYSHGRPNGWGLQTQFNFDPWQYQCSVRGPLVSRYAPGYTGPPQFAVGLTKMTGRIGLGFTVTRIASTTSAALQLQVSLGREPRSGKWASDAQSLAGSGAVSAVAFLDSNGNGVQDSGEATLEGAQFKVSGSAVQNRIQDPKVAFLTKLSRSQPLDISLNEASLEDSSQKSSVKAFAILPRAGKVQRLAFPITTFGEINGTTRVLRDGKRSEMGGLEVELVDGLGHQIKVLRSAYDGFFEFSDLPYGNYVLRVTSGETKRMRIKPSERPVQILANHNFLDGVDLVVEPET